MRATTQPLQGGGGGNPRQSPTPKPHSFPACLLIPPQCKEEVLGTVDAVQMLSGVGQLLPKSRENYLSRCMDLERLRRENTSQKEMDKVCWSRDQRERASMPQSGRHYTGRVVKPPDCPPSMVSRQKPKARRRPTA